jgi:predicted ATP-grasp superfamily ATP-dependent carboligase
VILLGGGPIAVSVARSLGKFGIPVHAVGNAEWDTVGHSRYCASFTHVPHENRPQQYFGQLAQRRWGEAAIFPCDDHSLELVARRRAELVGLGYRPIEAADDVLLAMLDKERTYQMAEQLGVGVPRRFVVEGPEGLDDQLAASGISFPCVLKPLNSHLFAQRFGTTAKVVRLPDRAALTRAVGELSSMGSKMMVTEIVPGPEDSYCSLYTYLDREGQPLVQFTKRKLRQYPVGFGLATYHVSIHDPELAATGLRFCQGVGLRGVACVEFKRDDRDGKLKLIECNHRFTLGQETLRYAGVNLPLVAYNALLGRPAPSFEDYRDGVHLWVPLADAQALRQRRRDGTLTVGQWAASLMHRQHFHLFDPTDPGPSLGLHARRVRRRLRRGRRRTGAGDR